ncbi:glycoside hydrolase [Lasiosphaeria miniovina]|uniref:Mannan endo-1,6-alpha-mannosidase n=1 Tax=Lasiosphaeria miniovina TaxID=1954250 RepID=A0AA40B485_9PEZI|nr:glycoside hydrolase [Lasiosphaeria miniovina]KAK0727320.1 glycoside hydrolase [Lasiosphaeria miniovina]
MRWNLGVAGAASLLLAHSAAVELTIGDAASTKAAAGTIAYGLMKYYTGNNTGDTPGNLPDPYFWWEAGAMFGTLIDYWALTGDATYNNVTSQALLHQASGTRDFMPANQTRTEGNDDQGFWAMAAMSAAENNFPNPPSDQPQWLALAQAVFNQYASRWDESTCGGGLRWQIFQFNNGFNYKNTISNGCFFNLAARLARFTGNETYADWATKIFAWEESVGLITPQYDIYDGVTIKDGSCNDTDRIQWSYNHGIFIHGAAVMHNVTGGAALWTQRVQGILKSTQNLFYNNSTGVVFEQFCEMRGFCDNDQRSFKGYLTRWLAGTAQMVSDTFDPIQKMLQASAAAAARACSGSPAENLFRGLPGTACGFRWDQPFDGSTGVGEQMNALSAVMYTLVSRATTTVTAESGGTSKGDPGGGAQGPGGGGLPSQILLPIPLRERVAAGFLTAGFVFGVIGGSAFVML